MNEARYDKVLNQNEITLYSECTREKYFIYTYVLGIQIPKQFEPNLVHEKMLW